MNEVDFLPVTFHETRDRRWRNLRVACVVLIVGIGLAMWHVRSSENLAGLRAYAQALDGRSFAATGQVSELARLQVERSRLIQQIRLQNELMPPVPTSVLLATISSLMPPSVGLTSLVIKAPDAVPPVLPTGKAAGKGASPSASRSGSPATGAPPPVVLVTLVGIAPNDDQITTFLGRIGDHPLFSQVKLLYSRGSDNKDLIIREFRIEMEMRLDRQFRHENGPSQEVAHAG